jgi:hypothetical protein
MVSSAAIPEACSTSGTGTFVAVKKEWVSPVLHAIALQAAEQGNGISSDSHKTGARGN